MQFTKLVENPSLPGFAQLADTGEVFYYARDDQNAMALYATDPTAGHRPRRLLREGEGVAGLTVRRVGLGDVNAAGSFALPVVDTTGLPAVLLYRNGAWERILQFGQTTPAGRVQRAPNVSLTDGDNLLVTAHLETGTRVKRALNGALWLPRADPSQARLLVTSGASLAGQAATLTRILNAELEGDDFIVQGVTSDGQQVLLKGSARQTAEPALLGGQALAVPRVAAAGRSGYVLHQGATATLTVDGRVALQTGTPSPLGESVVDIGPPLLGGFGQTAVALRTASGQELAMLGSYGPRTILRTGDAVVGKTLATMAAGALPSQMDAQAQLVFCVNFTDGTAAVVLGRPV